MQGESITLIGMSNAGKSYWRRELAQHGFSPYCCDDEIEKLLGPILTDGGYQGIEDVARWMGLPHEEYSRERQRRYLTQELLVMWKAMRQLRGERKLVIDSTGSVIYTGEQVRKNLRARSLVVLIDVPQSMQDEMYRQFLAKPKPVIWGDVYAPLPGESPEAALARCYPILLQTRNELYHKWAYVVVDRAKLHEPGFGTDDFLKLIGM